MNKENKLVPVLRFPQFNKNVEWKKDKIHNLFDLQDGYSFSSFDFVKDSKDAKQVIRITDINNQNKKDQKVYISDSKAQELNIQKYKVEKGDLLLSLTGAGGFNFYIWEDGAGYINQRTMKIVSRDEENHVIKILLGPQISQQINLIGTGQNNNLSKDSLKEIEFTYPYPEEQVKIANFISNLNQQIDAHNKKLILLEQHRKGLMQNLFPQNNEKKPKIRFPEFQQTGDWKLNPIGKIMQQVLRPVKMINSQIYSLVTVKRRYGGVVSRGIFKGADILVKSQFSILENDFLISKRQIVHCACGIVPKNLAGSIVSNEYSILTSIGENSIEFLNYFSQQRIIEQSFLKCSIGVVIEKMLFKTNEWLKMEFLFPEPDEQRKIASCLSALDELIKAQSEKIEQLKLHQKGLMHSLFPKANN